MRTVGTHIVHRIISVVAWTVLAGVLLATGYGSAETVSILLVDQRLMDVDKATIERFVAEHPGVEVDLRISVGDYVAQVYASYAAGTMPDIITRDLGSSAVVDLYEAGVIMDLTPFVERDADHYADWYPGLLDRARLLGTIPAVPRSQIQPYVLFYNRDHFGGAGVAEPDGEWTWTEFRDIGRRLTRDLDGDGAFDVFAWDSSWNHWQTWLKNNGVEIVNLDTWSTDLNTPESLEALEFLRALRFEDNVMPHPSYRWGSSRTTFGAGTLSMIQRQPHFANEIPDNVSAGVVLEPKGRSPVRYSMVTLQCFSISTQAKNPQLAWELIKYLTDSENARLSMAETGAMVAMRSLNQEFFGYGVPVANFREVFGVAMEQPQFLPYPGVTARTWSLIEELVRAAIETADEPVPGVVERFVSMIRRSLLEERLSR